MIPWSSLVKYRPISKSRTPPESDLYSSGRSPSKRPRGVTALAVFFLAGSAISGVSSLSLLTRWSVLEPMWRLNPRAWEAFARIGGWGVVLLSVVCLACAAASTGLWRGARWGYRLAITLIAINLAGDAVNGVLGTEPRALAGVPIAAALLFYLSSRRVRAFFLAAPARRQE